MSPRWGERIDNLVTKLRSQKYFALIDCKQCANCCRSLQLEFTGSELHTIAKTLGQSIEAFEKQCMSEGKVNSPLPDCGSRKRQRNSNCDSWGVSTLGSRHQVVTGWAEISVADKFRGSSPSSRRLASSDHKIKIEKSGFRSWERTLSIGPGAKARVDAPLEKQE